MSMMQAVGSAFRHYAVFRGRARRSEYWKFMLFNVLFSVVFVVLSDTLFANGSEQTRMSIVGVAGLYMLIAMLPALAVMVRRLHDTGRTGWLVLAMLIPVVGAIMVFIWLVTPGDPGENAYGPDPKAVNEPVRKAAAAPRATVPPAPEVPRRPAPETPKTTVPPASETPRRPAPEAPAAPRVTVNMSHSKSEKKPTDQYWQTPTDF